ncbi:Peptide chain release factor 3 [Streptomyces tanashiensis]
MGDKAKTPAGAAGRAPTADRPSAVRNVVLVGHSGSGKTTLVEALAQTAGAVNRAGRVEDGGTVSDYDEIEHRQQRSVQLSLVPVGWDGYKINLLDTPGYADFVGELRAGLRAADAALFVVSAAQEADAVAASTRMIWEECAAVGMPAPSSSPTSTPPAPTSPSSPPSAPGSSAATTPTPSSPSICRCAAPRAPTGTRPPPVWSACSRSGSSTTPRACAGRTRPTRRSGS